MVDEHGMEAMDGTDKFRGANKFWGLLTFEGFHEPLFGMNFHAYIIRNCLKIMVFRFILINCVGRKVYDEVSQVFMNGHRMNAKIQI